MPITLCNGFAASGNRLQHVTISSSPELPKHRFCFPNAHDRLPQASAHVVQFSCRPVPPEMR